MILKNLKLVVVMGAAALLVSASAMASQYGRSTVDSGFSMGASQGELSWDIAGSLLGESPNILSELQWTDLNVIHMRYHARSYGRKKERTYYGFEGDYGFIVAGDNQDSDYFSDNRQDEFSRSNNSGDGGNTMDLSVSMGYTFGKKYRKDGGWVFIPMIGYSRHEQSLVMVEGNQTVATDNITPPEGTFGGLDSEYNATWDGPWVGIRAEYDKGRSFSFFLDYQVHQIDYEADADWNLRDDFAHPTSFTHTAKGDGVIASMGLQYKIKKGFSLGVSLDHQLFVTARGLDETYFSDGTTGQTQLNGATWESTVLMIRPKFTF